MTDDPGKHGSLDEKIKAARADFSNEYEPSKSSKTDTDSDSNAGYEFLAYVISGGLIGFFLDRFIGTMPWGLILFIILGFVAGVYRAKERAKKSD